MGFVLSEHAAPLDYDFGNGVKGTVPEPSSKAVNKFLARLRLSVRAAGVEIDDTASSVELSRVMQGLTAEQMDAVTDESTDAICEVTQNHPTREDLDAAGHRPRQAFLGWLLGELTRPEGAKPGTTRTPAALPGA
ncbi:hypothetical protein [Amycolatopsis taiwanensis]|uniref:hypothetical protein n=1 Tax=Amycolatopsis taiwanensis TaxID=342230 RepID=UPI0004883B5B|nr:hypothetical protein [Amycolatopsis taiwanensis]